jgi:hypothetical protein
VNVWGGKNAENGATFKGKSAGILSVDGILYAWINLQNSNTPDHRLAWSSDLGATWQLSDWKFSSSIFALASFLNFGMDYGGAREGYVYSYGGKWKSSSPVFLARVPKDRIREREAYEFFNGLDANSNPKWTKDTLQYQPVFSDPNSTDLNGANHASVVYNSGINRYLLTVPHAKEVAKWGIFDAPEPWGPWTTVAYYDNWGGFSSSEALLYVLPTKWMSADGKTMWCIFSGRGIFDSFNLVRATLTLKTGRETS